MMMGYVGKSMTAAGGRGGPTCRTARLTWAQHRQCITDLDKDAAEQAPLEKIMRDTLRVPLWYIEKLRAELGHKSLAEHLAAWRRWLAEQACGASNRHPSSKATA